MTTLQSLSIYLEELLQVSLFKDYCPNGLQVEGKKEINKMATAVSASLSTIKKAVEMSVDALFVHHGLFWKGDGFPLVGSKKEKIALLLENEISLFAYHLPLDAHQQFGNNWKAAKDLGWSDLQPFGLFNGLEIGVRGKFPEIPKEEFQQQLEKYYEHPAHTAPGGRAKVSSAALISGGAHNSINEAAAAKVDCFITGSFDEPVWHIAEEEEVNFFALGHSATERVGPQAIGKHLAEKFEMEMHFIDISNPF